jgi:hypothetical protein
MVGAEPDDVTERVYVMSHASQRGPADRASKIGSASAALATSSQ